MQHRVPCACHDLRLHDVVRVVLGVGDDEHAAQFLRHAPAPADASRKTKAKTFATQWMFDVWRNKFLFCGIMAGFILTFPILYIPVINDVVFKHTGISWEWGVVFVEGFLFVLGVEAWKWCKRVFFRRRQRKFKAISEDPALRSRDFSQYTSMSRDDEKAEQAMV